MRLEGKRILVQLQKKNRGNVKLLKAIDQLITDLESAEIDLTTDLKAIRQDIEKVNKAGFYFLNIHLHRTLVLIVIDSKNITIVWAGDHDEYERIFKNNKNSIEKWLKSKDLL